MHPLGCGLNQGQGKGQFVCFLWLPLCFFFCVLSTLYFNSISLRLVLCLFTVLISIVEGIMHVKTTCSNCSQMFTFGEQTNLV